MINQQLLDYIKQQLAQGVSKEIINSNLLLQGWQQADLNEGFSASENQNAVVPPMPQSEVATIKYAGFWIRVAANFLDGIIVFFFSITLAFIAGVILGVAGLIEEGIKFTQLLAYIVSFGYFIFLTYKKEATWGKMALGIKVISSEKEKLSLGQVILRETIGKIASGLILGIGYIMVAFTEKKQALHDIIAKTYVIHKDPAKKNTTWIIIAIIGFAVVSIAIIGILASIVLVSLNSARGKASEAAFKAEVSSIVPSMLIACDENNIITVKDLGSPKYFDPNIAIKTLTQNCKPGNIGSFSITINGTGKVSSKSAVCTDNGCTFK